MPSFSDVYASVKLDLDAAEENRLKKRIAKIDTKDAGKDVATRFGVGFNGAFGGIASKSAGLFVGAFAAIKGAQVFGSFIADAAESEKVARITANAIKATGGAAKITADQVSDLATSISNKTAIDDEQVQTAANMLLTFKNIRNETGKNNDIFNQATQAAADLSIQFGGIDGASKQLGKALNDPVKGITALSKAGVTFTEQQKQQIKTLTASGDVLGAQKIILKEIAGQVGGAAAAAADPLDRLRVIGGNLAEEFGGILLPAANGFATFMSNKVAPALSLVFGRASDFTKSQGFQNFLADVEAKGRSAFGFIRDEALPRLKDFGSFINATVIPSLTNLAGAFAPLAADVGTAVAGAFQRLLPLLKDFGGFLGGTVLPAVKDFTKFLKDNSTLVGSVAVGVGAMVVAFKAYHAALIVGSALTKAITAVTAAWNVVMKLNPIGVVVLALVGLAAGLTYAYKNSETFRKVVDTAFKAVAAAGTWLWQVVLKPVFGFFAGAFKKLWEDSQTVARIMKQAFDAIKEPVRAALAFVVEKFLSFVGTIIEGAADAFSWVPGLGPKLRTASEDFKKFKEAVNKQLDGIDDEPVNIKVDLAYTQALGQKTKNMKFAGGGKIFGPGSPTSDRIPILASPTEWVIKGKSATKYGDKAMASVNDGTATILPGFATGGRPGLLVGSNLPGSDRLAALARAASSAVDHTGSVMAKAIAKNLTTGSVYPGPPGSVRGFRGEPLNTRTINMILAAERLLGGKKFPITQGSYQQATSYSGTTHTGGGVFDSVMRPVMGAGVAALRRVGFAAWDRTGKGNWAPHIHAVAIGDPTASSSAKAQVRDFLRGGDGLGGFANGGAVLPIKKYDAGGQWPTGTFGFNGTGKTETVRTSEQEAGLARPVNVRVFIGDRELRDVVRVEIDENDSAKAKQFLTGPI